MKDTPSPPPFDLDALLLRFKAAAQKAARGLPYRDVVQGLGEFGELQQANHAETRGATLFPWGLEADVSVTYLTGTPSFAPNGAVSAIEPSDRVWQLVLDIIGDTVTLADVERAMGAWYRDPPPPDPAAFAHAYFNAQAICPAPGLFLYAVSQPHADSLGPQSPVCTVGVAYGDDRYGKKEPW